MNNVDSQKDPPASQCRSSIRHLAQVVQVKLSLMIFKPYNFNSKDKLSDDKPSEDKLSEDKLLEDKLSGDKLLRIECWRIICWRINF